jgi:hypothetical protein
LIDDNGACIDREERFQLTNTGKIKKKIRTREEKRNKKREEERRREEEDEEEREGENRQDYKKSGAKNLFWP